MAPQSPLARAQHADNWSRLSEGTEAAATKEHGKFASPAPLPSSPVLVPSSPAQQNAGNPGQSPCRDSRQGSPARDDIEMEDVGNYADSEVGDDNDNDDDDCMILVSHDGLEKQHL